MRGCLRVSYKKRGAKILNLVRVMLLVQMRLFGQCSLNFGWAKALVGLALLSWNSITNFYGLLEFSNSILIRKDFNKLSK